jgi:hypothetical protein
MNTDDTPPSRHPTEPALPVSVDDATYTDLFCITRCENLHEVYWSIETAIDGDVHATQEEAEAALARFIADVQALRSAVR